MKNSTMWTVTGVLSLIGGIVAFLNPFGASLAVSVLAGWAFLFVGLLQLVLAFQVNETGAKIWAILWAALVTWLGISLLWNPLEGLLVLTLAAGIIFVASGVMRALTAMALRGSAVFWPLLISSIFSMLLGAYVLATYPQSAGVLLGTLLAIELIFNGIGLIMLGSTGRKVEQALSS